MIARNTIAASTHKSSSGNTALHVVHGVQALDVGGLERIVLDLARVGRRRGQRVSVVCLERPGLLAPQVEAEGATVLSLDKPPGRTRSLTKQVVDLFAQLDADVLHTHTVGALWYLGPVAKKVRGMPVIHTEHIDNVGKASHWWKKLKMRILWHRASRYADRFCCVSEDVARSAKRWGAVPQAKVETILNGIDTDRFVDQSTRNRIRSQFGIASGSWVLGTVGRLNEVKNQDLLLCAVAMLGRDCGDVHILLVGDGPERASLERMASELGLSSRTHFAGYQQKPELFLPAMDVFALTSRIEGLPLALLEAWAARIPVIASAVGGIPRVVVDGVNGILFPSGDAAALSRGLSKLFSDRVEAIRMAAAGQEEVRKHYSLDRMAIDYEKRYLSLLFSRGGPR